MSYRKKMNPAFIFISLFLFLGTSIISGEEIDKSKITFLKWMGPGRPGTYEGYIASRPIEPFTIEEVFVPEHYSAPAKKKPKVLVIVETSLYSSLETEIKRYVSSVKSQGYDVRFYKSSGGKAENLKTFIKKKKKRLIGC